MDFLLWLAHSAGFKHPCATLLHVAEHLFPVLWFPSVFMAEGSGQMVTGTSAEAVNPSEWTQSLAAGLRNDLQKVPTALPS